MRRTTLVIAIGLLLSTGCYTHHRGYYGYYGGGYYGSSQVAYNQPQPQPEVQGQVAVQQPPPPPPTTTAAVTVSGEGISGSDGTRGWRIVSQAPSNDLQRLVQLTGRASCHVEGVTNFEFKGTCSGNVHVIVRIDQQNVYKLCAPGTDPNACAQVWGMIGN